MKTTVINKDRHREKTSRKTSYSTGKQTSGANTYVYMVMMIEVVVVIIVEAESLVLRFR
jgi:hypothetical protein